MITEAKPDKGEPNEPPELQKPRLLFPGEGHLFAYMPKEDITAFELAEATGLLATISLVATGKAPPRITEMFFVTMSEGAKRHFAVKQKSNLVVPGQP